MEDIPITMIDNLATGLNNAIKSMATAVTGGGGPRVRGCSSGGPTCCRPSPWLGLPASLANNVLYQMQTESRRKRDHRQHN